MILSLKQVLHGFAEFGLKDCDLSVQDWGRFEVGLAGCTVPRYENISMTFAPTSRDTRRENNKYPMSLNELDLE